MNKENSLNIQKRQNTGRAISFRVESKEIKDLLEEIALREGHRNVSSMCYFALNKYLSRYYKEDVEAVQRLRAEAKNRPVN